MNKDNTIVINNWVLEFANFIAQESLKLVETTGKPKKLVKELSLKLLHFYVKSIIKNSLTEYTNLNLDKKDAYDFTIKNFTDVKFQIQGEVAMAFEAAAREFSGRSIDYYCKISAIPDPINKEAC